MAKAKAPLLSFSSKGTLAGSVTHRRHRSLTIVQKKPIPSQPRTPAQLLQRNYFLSGIETWHTLDASELQMYYNLNPQIGANPAYLNFMKEWLMAHLPLHGDDHADGERDPITKPLPAAAHPPTTYSLPASHNHPTHHAIRTNYYFLTPLFIGYNLPTSYAYSPNNIRALPYPIITPKTIDRMAAYVSSGSPGAFMRLAIYSNTPPARPGALLAQSSPIDASSAGLKTWDISLSLDPGLYWLAELHDTTISFYRSQSAISLLGGTTGYSQYLSYYYPFVYNPFPDPAPDMTTFHDSWIFSLSLRFT